MINVSTPSRICLFGEHQDYLGLEVITLAIDLRFSGAICLRNDNLIRISIRDSKIDALNAENTNNSYEHYEIDLSRPIVYQKKGDYLLSSVNVLLREGYPLRGADIKLDSSIPIGKGMCSSSTMIVALIKALLESAGVADKDDPYRIAHLAFTAEVLEFNEPGGMMDHYSSALGGLLHTSFSPEVVTEPIERRLEGCFILFDSLQQKDTIRVLAESKLPTLEAIELLKPLGITSVKDFYHDASRLEVLTALPETPRRKLEANISNYRILRTALKELQTEITPERLGKLIYEHHKNLRDGLGVSTTAIEAILDTALRRGAWGGKINGSGGGGCCYAYCARHKASDVIEAVNRLGYPAKILHQDTGVRVDAIDEERKAIL